MRRSAADLLAGALLTGIGLFVVWQSLYLPVGTLSRMGPGYFPLLLGTAQALLGIAILVFDRRGQDEADEIAASVPAGVRLRAIAVLTAAPLMFAALIEPAGLVPAVFGAVFISSFADRNATFGQALLLAAGVTIGSVLVFKIGLNLSIDMIG